MLHVRDKDVFVFFICDCDLIVNKFMFMKSKKLV
jgi:hypothetical protein